VSRYLLLFLLNLPFILAAMLSAITQYKLDRGSGRRLAVQLGLWSVILIGLGVAQPVYEWLYNHQLTETEPLSLFDVIQITAIVITFYIANRTRAKLEVIERRLQDLHQEISIRLSEDKNGS